MFLLIYSLMNIKILQIALFVFFMKNIKSAIYPHSSSFLCYSVYPIHVFLAREKEIQNGRENISFIPRPVFVRLQVEAVIVYFLHKDFLLGREIDSYLLLLSRHIRR